MHCSFALTILIDPGHGGEDDGAKAETVGRTPPEMIKEKDIALSIAQKIYEKLQAKNHTVFLTRSLDRTVSLPERAAIAEKTKADLFISELVMSCRVLKRGVEEFIMNYLFDFAKSKNLKLISGEIRKTEKNRLVLDFFTRWGFEKTSERNNLSEWRLLVQNFKIQKTFVFGDF